MLKYLQFQNIVIDLKSVKNSLIKTLKLFNENV